MGERDGDFVGDRESEFAAIVVVAWGGESDDGAAASQDVRWGPGEVVRCGPGFGDDAVAPEVGDVPR